MSKEVTSTPASKKNLGNTCLTNSLLSFTGTTGVEIFRSFKYFDPAGCDNAENPASFDLANEEQPVAKMYSIQKCLSSQAYHYPGPRAEQ